MSDEIEDKIVIETGVRRLVTDNMVSIPVRDLGVALAEVYQKASRIGWETKALDALNDLIRDIHNA